MKTRVVLGKAGRFKVQYNTFIFWHDDGEKIHDYSGGSYTSTTWHDSEHQATIRMIQMVQEYEVKMAKNKASGVVKEFSSEELKDKFAEHFV